MKKFILVALLAVTVNMQAQEPGAAASNAANAGKSSNWDKWVFTGGGALAVAGGLISLFVVGANGSNVTVNPLPATTSH
ncbi:MAG: hypothetical protein K1X28_09690 [Parachlamydiales bacterium]|nr:hypothetical protein [Parachlamydiales bacterium]